MILSKNKHHYLLASWNNERNKHELFVYAHTCQNHGFHNLQIYNNSKIEVFMISSVRGSFSQWLRGHPSRTSDKNWDFQTPLPRVSGLNNRIPTKITIDVRFPETPPPPGKPDVLDGWPLT